MKSLTLAMLAISLAATPAFAMEVTNLDKVAHKVALTGTGQPEIRLIEPNKTEYFTGGVHGFLAIVDDVTPAPKKKSKHSSVVHMDGMLSGVVGNERTDGIPADAQNNYVIWEGGKIALQSRRKTQHGNR